MLSFGWDGDLYNHSVFVCLFCFVFWFFLLVHFLHFFFFVFLMLMKEVDSVQKIWSINPIALTVLADHTLILQ